MDEICNIISALSEYLPKEKMTEIAEEIYRKKFEEFIDEAITNRTLGFNNNTIELLLDRAVLRSVNKIIDLYDDDLLDLIYKVMKSDISSDQFDFYNGITDILIEECKHVIENNKDEIDVKLAEKVSLVLNKLTSDEFASRLSYALRSDINNTIMNEIKKLADLK